MKNNKIISRTLLGVMLLSIIVTVPILPFKLPQYSYLRNRDNYPYLTTRDPQEAISKRDVLLVLGIYAAIFAGVFWLTWHEQITDQNPWHAILPEQRRVLRSKLQNIQTSRATLADVLGPVDFWKFLKFIMIMPKVVVIIKNYDRHYHEKRVYQWSILE